MQASGIGIDPKTLHIRAENSKQPVKEMCKEFESVFLYYFVKEMQKGLYKNDIFYANTGEDVFRDMLNVEMSRQMAASNETGLADVLNRQLTGSSSAGFVR